MITVIISNLQLDQIALLEYTRAIQASESGRPGSSPYNWPLMDPQMPTPPRGSPRGGSPRNISKNRVRIHPTNGRGKEVKGTTSFHTVSPVFFWLQKFIIPVEIVIGILVLFDFMA